jgi:acetylornithine/succinyldiaminopimelate/putrescine aminotransferase
MTPEALEGKIVEHANRFRGRMCGLIESFGLPEKQERAAIATVKSLSYDEENALRKLVNPDSTVA